MMSQLNRADNFTNPDYLQGMDIKDWVKAARRFRVGLTQEALAEALSCTKAAISHWESGRNIPSLQQAMAISALTGYPLLGPDAKGLFDEAEHGAPGVPSVREKIADYSLDHASKFVESSRRPDVGPHEGDDEMSEFETRMLLGLLRKLSPERRIRLGEELMSEVTGGQELKNAAG